MQVEFVQRIRKIKDTLYRSNPYANSGKRMMTKVQALSDVKEFHVEVSHQFRENLKFILQDNCPNSTDEIYNVVY